MSERTSASLFFVANCAETSCHYTATRVNGGLKRAKLGERIAAVGWLRSVVAKINYVHLKFCFWNDFACLKRPLKQPCCCCSTSSCHSPKNYKKKGGYFH